MRILQVASEVALVAKAGGLGDVLTGLSRELHHQGLQPLVVLPRYGCMSYEHLHPTGEKEHFVTYFQGARHEASIDFYLLQNEIPVGLIDTDSGKWRSREAIYGQSDEVASFIAFNKVCFDWLIATKREFDIVHLHDWQTSYLAPLLRYAWRGETPAPKIVLTLHNIEYQGKCSFEEVLMGHPDIIQLAPRDLFCDPWHDCVNLLKAAIASSDLLVAVSPTYAKEILTPEGGKGLDGVLLRRKSSLHGILNGIDTTYWNPSDDPFLPEQYSVKDEKKKIVHAKKAAKCALFEMLAIDEAFCDLPLIGAVARLVHQKGLPLIQYVLENLESLGCTGVLLGSTYEEAVHKTFHGLDGSLLKNRRGRVLLQTNESIAHLIYAASDLLLVPSLFEPCGLTQMIALHYGTIPIARKTGGLADTVVDCQYGESKSEGNGFVFDLPDIGSMKSALDRALQLHTSSPECWDKLLISGMKMNVSWALPAKKYVRLYSTLI